MYALLIAGVIELGLATRAKSIQPFLPECVPVYAGDALRALTVFLGTGFVWPKLATGRIAVYALIFCWLIEFSQLDHAPWLEEIRHTRAGGLVLGDGFLPRDLLCYAVGVAKVVAGELAVAAFRQAAATGRAEARPAVTAVV